MNSLQANTGQIIFLIGFMGSGKSTVGKRLAQKMNLPFLDSDAEIERTTNLSISELFSTQGESHFRQLEFDFISKLIPETPQIISCGGGLPCFNGLMNELKSKGTVVFLNASAPTLIKRLHNQRKFRPLLSELSDEEFAETIQNRLADRMEIYAQANIQVDVDTYFIEKLVDEIIRILD